MHLIPHCDRAISGGTSASKRLMFSLNFRFAAFKVDIVRSSPLALLMNQHKCSIFVSVKPLRSHLAFVEQKLLATEGVTFLFVLCSWRSFGSSATFSLEPCWQSLQADFVQPISPFARRNLPKIAAHNHSHNVALIGSSVTQLRRLCCHANH
jgi:hypothetical protein